MKPLRSFECNSAQSLSCVVLTSDSTWVSRLTTRKQNHILCKLSIRNSKFKKTQSLLKSSFFKARLFHCPFWFLSGSRGEDKLHLLKEQRGESRAGSQVQPRTAMQNIRKISAGRGLRRSSLPPPTQGRESFKADQVALQASNVSTDRELCNVREICSSVWLSLLVKNFFPTARTSLAAFYDHCLLSFHSVKQTGVWLCLLCNPP